jgi:hypothetical protein
MYLEAWKGEGEKGPSRSGTWRCGGQIRVVGEQEIHRYPTRRGGGGGIPTVVASVVTYSLGGRGDPRRRRLRRGSSILQPSFDRSAAGIFIMAKRESSKTMMVSKAKRERKGKLEIFQATSVCLRDK